MLQVTLIDLQHASFVHVDIYTDVFTQPQVHNSWSTLIHWLSAMNLFSIRVYIHCERLWYKLWWLLLYLLLYSPALKDHFYAKFFSRTGPAVLHQHFSLMHKESSMFIHQTVIFQKMIRIVLSSLYEDTLEKNSILNVFTIGLFKLKLHLIYNVNRHGVFIRDKNVIMTETARHIWE